MPLALFSSMVLILKLLNKNDQFGGWVKYACVLIFKWNDYGCAAPKHEIPLKMSEISQWEKENTNRAHRTTRSDKENWNFYKKKKLIWNFKQFFLVFYTWKSFEFLRVNFDGFLKVEIAVVLVGLLTNWWWLSWEVCYHSKLVAGVESRSR